MTLTDLDFLDEHSNGLHLKPKLYTTLKNTIRYDVNELNRWGSNDYSLFLSIYYMKDDEMFDDKLIESRSGVIVL